MEERGVTKHSLEVLAFRSVKRARDIFLAEPGAPPAPIEVSVKHCSIMGPMHGTHTHTHTPLHFSHTTKLCLPRAHTTVPPLSLSPARTQVFCTTGATASLR